MLQELTIKNFAIISELRLTFEKGMTALTGETGAGKSIIIDAVGLLAGGRGSSDYIRQGADKCLLEGIFSTPASPEFSQLMMELGIDQEEDLIVQRDMNRSGKNVCRINGRTVTLANLRRIGSFLVDIQGQNEHQELMDPEKHLSLLDSFGDASFVKVKSGYEKIYEEYRETARKFQKLQKDEQFIAQRADMLSYQQEEIAAAELIEGEEEQLNEEKERLVNFQKITNALAASYEALNNAEFGALDQVGSATNELQEISGLAKDYEEIAGNVQSAYYLLQDAASDLNRQLDLLEMDEGRLEEINQRLEIIHQLKRKYGQTVADVLAHYEKISGELAELDFSEGAKEKLEQQVAEKKTRVLKQGTQLHQLRKKIATELEKEIQQELKELYMEHTIFEVRFLEEALSESGLDAVEFFITTNPGEPLKPLVKVASGGELSRVMLALKTIFTRQQHLTSIVFDEVDTGVSGRVAQAIADKIYQIGRNSQVLCITHLPQVAAKADQQYFISKAIYDGRTETKVECLTESERVHEIARMLSGAEITDLTLQHARELLETAKK